MIRSNPTAIPLRPSDLKHLQTEIEKRKAAQAGSGHISSAEAQSTNERPGTAEVGKKDEGAFNAVEEGRKERQGRTVAERIGL